MPRTLDNQKEVLEYWYSKLRFGGILFLYLPHPDQEYWYQYCKKHKKVVYPKKMRDLLKNIGYKEVHISERDFNYSYVAYGEKE